METILEYVQRRLREIGSDRWEAVAHAAGAPPSTPRKLVYERKEPSVNTVEPLYRYLQKVDSGELHLPAVEG